MVATYIYTSICMIVAAFFFISQEVDETEASELELVTITHERCAEVKKLFTDYGSDVNCEGVDK